MENIEKNKNNSIEKCKEQYGRYCCVSMEESIHSRRCFMTGEYCSQQANIRYEREKLHKNNHISAFVIMNFSDMSDIVYQWRLYDFIESLSKYLYFSKDKKELYCHISDTETKASKDINEGIEQVKKIHVSRSDSDLASNYVTCTRVCQQMQIADLIIVDVSSQNANVFYELGMAIAFRKLILPICYSESYYKRLLPDELKQNKHLYEKVKHHIGCFPWRKTLFEYYGIQYRRYLKDKINDNNGKTCYIDFDIVKDAQYGFSDTKYNHFPYHENIEGHQIGQLIYGKLANEYNKSCRDDNTLVIYTIENFLDKENVGRCIINFYCNIVARMIEERCFYGERVGILVQENSIQENDRDSIEQQHIRYSIGKVINIGVNRATNLSIKRKDRIKTNDVMAQFKEQERFELEQCIDDTKLRPDKMTKLQKKQIKYYIKKYVREKGFLIYPNNPIYVKRVKNGIDKLILEENKNKSPQFCKYANMQTFCFYHVMLEMLHNTNEIVVDISNNCLQSLFWLGVAHGSSIPAIPVVYKKIDEEKESLTGNIEKKTRNIFDVAGLGTAILHSDNIKSFYRQLVLAQKGIEQQLFLRMPKRICSKKERSKKENNMLQVYYLNYFWKRLLKYNQLQIFLPKNIEKESYISELYFQIVGVLSNYLSRRTPIGEYEIKTFIENGTKLDISESNCIYIGKKTTPLETILLQYTGVEKWGDKQSEVIVFDKTNEEKDMGQFVLWREDSKGLYKRNIFYVSITGVSEKVTLGLISLLVNEEQKLFCQLQQEARKKFMDVFRERLLKKLIKILGGEEDREKRYINLVEYTVTYYLNTVLFRYFFPFLTDRDIERIYNGMKTLINSMKVDGKSPFCITYLSYEEAQYEEVIENEKVEKIIHSIPMLLKEVLESFRGLKVLIKEEKSLENLKEETILYNIDDLDIKIAIERKNINCFFECK